MSDCSQLRICAATICDLGLSMTMKLLSIMLCDTVKQLD